MRKAKFFAAALLAMSSLGAFAQHQFTVQANKPGAEIQPTNDSFVGRLSCIFQGSTDTTFYILAVYFGSVSIRNTRHAVVCGLLADLAGVIAAIAIAYLFFG